MSCVLVTGASGFLGSCLLSAFNRKGVPAIGVSRSKGKESSEHPLYLLDLKNPAALEELMRRYSVSAVVHCASQQPRHGLDFNAYYEGNVCSLNNLLPAMQRVGVRKLLMFSSTAVYKAAALNSAINEESVTEPCSEYSISKLTADHLARVQAKEMGLDVVCFRIPSLFGARQEGGLVHTYYRYALQGCDIELYSRGEPLRNLLYVDDLVEACFAALEYLSSTKCGFELFLFGSLDSISMVQLAEYIVKCMKSSSRIMPVDTPIPVPGNWVLDLQRAKEILHLTPIAVKQGIDRYLKEMRHVSH